MTAFTDVAYLDAPHVARAERIELIMSMSPDCWEDACHDCRVPGCACACHDDPPPRALPAAGPPPALTDAERIMRLADSIRRRS